LVKRTSYTIFSHALFEFPITEIRVDVPKWVLSLEDDHWLIQYVMDAARAASEEVLRIRDVDTFGKTLEESEFMERPKIDNIDLGTGNVLIRMDAKSGLFYKVLGEECGYEIKGDYQMIGLMKELAHAKGEYDRIAGP
jgi:stage IV sporulation protein A